MSERDKTEFEKQYPEIPIIGSVGDADLMDVIEAALRDSACDMKRDRPYNGQPWTDSGERGKTLVSSLTLRDVRDCFIRAVVLCAHEHHPALYAEAEKGEAAKLNTDTLFEVDFTKLDPLAIAQQLSCEIERAMGIFPNLPPECRLQE